MFRLEELNLRSKDWYVFKRFSPRAKSVSPQNMQYRKKCRNGLSRDWLVTNCFSPFEKVSVWDWKLIPIVITATENVRGYRIKVHFSFQRLWLQQNHWIENLMSFPLLYNSTVCFTLIRWISCKMLIYNWWADKQSSFARSMNTLTI